LARSPPAREAAGGAVNQKELENALNDPTIHGKVDVGVE
jgi:hypothetical protein